MEDVIWKDHTGLVMTSFPETPYLHRHNNPITTTALRPGSTTFQDFLGIPFSHINGPQMPPQPKRKHNNNGSSSSNLSPATALSLNTGSEFQHIIHSPNNNSFFRPMIKPNYSNPFDQSFGSSFGKTGFPTSSGETSSSITITPTNPVDRKHKRLIKNRESSARSRARKEAYINELELNLEEVREENRLMKQIEEIRQARQAQLPKKSDLQRSSSAPF